MKTYYVIPAIRAIADLVAPGELTPGWTITRINVPAEHRGHGHGTALLRAICADADDERVTLWLEVQPSGALDHAALTAWYGRHGFRLHRRSGYLVRRPRGGKPVDPEDPNCNTDRDANRETGGRGDGGDSSRQE